MTQVTWQQLTSNLKMAELGATASECHGIVCGLICGGINLQDNSWYGAFNDLMNDGIALPIDLKKMLQQVFDDTSNEFLADDYQVRLLIADDEQYLNERAKSLAQWVESFMVGFAILMVSMFAFMMYETPEEAEQRIQKYEAFEHLISGEASCPDLKIWLSDNIKMNQKSEGGLLGSSNYSWNKYQQVNQMYELGKC